MDALIDPESARKSVYLVPPYDVYNSARYRTVCAWGDVERTELKIPKCWTFSGIIDPECSR